MHNILIKVSNFDGIVLPKITYGQYIKVSVCYLFLQSIELVNHALGINVKCHTDTLGSCKHTIGIRGPGKAGERIHSHSHNPYQNFIIAKLA